MRVYPYSLPRIPPLYSPFRYDHDETAYQPLIENERAWAHSQCFHLVQRTSSPNGWLIQSIVVEQLLEHIYLHACIFCKMLNVPDFLDGREEAKFKAEQAHISRYDTTASLLLDAGAASGLSSVFVCHFAFLMTVIILGASYFIPSHLCCRRWYKTVPI